MGHSKRCKLNGLRLSKIHKYFAPRINLYSFVHLNLGDVAQVVEHRTENP